MAVNKVSAVLIQTSQRYPAALYIIIYDLTLQRDKTWCHWQIAREIRSAKETTVHIDHFLSAVCRTIYITLISTLAVEDFPAGPRNKAK